MVGRLRRRAFGGNLDFEVSLRNRDLEPFLRSKFNKKIANWKAESLRNPISKELAPEDASIASYGDFESDRSAVGRLRRRTASPSDRSAVGRLRRRVFGNSSKIAPLVLTNSRKRKKKPGCARKVADRLELKAAVPRTD